MGHICILGSWPRITRTGPKWAVVSAVVSLKVTRSVITRPTTEPWKRAGSEGPT